MYLFKIMEFQQVFLFISGINVRCKQLLFVLLIILTKAQSCKPHCKRFSNIKALQNSPKVSLHYMLKPHWKIHQLLIAN